MALSSKSRWYFGEKSELARRSGISKQHLGRILKGAAVTRHKGRKLIMIAKDMGKDIEYLDFIDSDITSNPLFANKFALKNTLRLTNDEQT